MVPITAAIQARLLATQADCLEITRVDEENAADGDHVENCGCEDELDCIPKIEPTMIELFG